MKPELEQTKMYQTDKYAHELRYLLVKVIATGMIYKLLMFGIDTDSNQFSRLFISLADRFMSVKKHETCGIKRKDLLQINNHSQFINSNPRPIDK